MRIISFIIILFLIIYKCEASNKIIKTTIYDIYMNNKYKFKLNLYKINIIKLNSYYYLYYSMNFDYVYRILKNINLFRM
jgi:hypothetical protein